MATPCQHIAGRQQKGQHAASLCRNASGLFGFDGLFAHQPDLEIARLMQGIHHFHHRLVIDGFIRAEEDGGIFLPAVRLSRR